MIYYGCTHSIFFSEDFVRDIMLHSDYAFTQDSKSGHWKFLKYRYSKEGLNTQFFNVQDLLDYVYKDMMNCFHRFPRELMGHLTPLPELDYSDISQFSYKDPYSKVIAKWRMMIDLYKKPLPPFN